MIAENSERKPIVQEIPTVTAVTKIHASVDEVWRVLVAFDEYKQWHPILSLDVKSDRVAVGVNVPGRLSDGNIETQSVTMRVIDVEPRSRLVWEGGSLDVILGRHSFVLTGRPDGITELTDSEEFFGTAAHTIIPLLGQLTQDCVRYGAALKARVEARCM
ncbi:SRPBCC family protein [Streptomyces phaeochromogenes]|uniref:SRPBCC family protein n=1 Tax=Streptomyces phaeochromogenes TaxID=1923 RepID=UPI0033CB0919